MAKKPLTRTLATALAVKVKDRLVKETRGLNKTIEAKITASKEWKQYVKLNQEHDELGNKLKNLQEDIADKYSVPLVNVRVYSNHVSVSENHRVISTDHIRDTLLIEEYMSGESETVDQLVERIVSKIKNG